MNRRAVRATHIAHLAFFRGPRQHLSLLRGCIPGLLCLLAITACAAAQEQRFPLERIPGNTISDFDWAREALPAYQRMGADLERQGRMADAAVAYLNASTLARVLGRLQDALVGSQKAVEAAERAGTPLDIAGALNRLGNMQMDLNAPHRAIPILERAVKYAQEAGRPGVQARTYGSLSRAYRKLGNPERALENATRAVEALENALQMARVGRRRAGARGGERIRNLERHYADALLDLGRTHLSLEQWDPARRTFQRALEVGTQIEASHVMAWANRGLGAAAAGRGELAVAVSNLEEALQLAERPNFIAETQGVLGRIYRSMNRLPEAEGALRQALEGIEDMRSMLQSEELRESFVEDKMGMYGHLIQVLFDQGKLSEAFHVSERARARAFLDLLGNRVSLSKGTDAALVAEEKALQERIAQLKARSLLEDDQEEGAQEETDKERPRPKRATPQRELELAREAYAAFLARVRAQNREQASLMTVEPLTLAEVQVLLPPEAVLLEYFVGGGRTLLWAVSRKTLQAIPLKIGRVELARRVTELRELIASRARTDDLHRAARELYSTLVAPAFPSGFPRELLIVPHDALHYLPFQALMSAPDRYLIQEAPLYYYSSASLMQFTRAKVPAHTSAALAVGNPELDNPVMNLRYAEREVREVGRQFPAATVLIRKEATKERTRRQMGSQALIHLATHAELDEEDPLGSALLLRADGTDTGRLEVQEIFGLDLHASLVVLSACETALGKLTRGDELTGLTRAFIYAGTPSIITTLWKVNDRSSYELMREFYEHLKAGRDKAEALRQAQLATLQKYPHPYYWAAYQLTGEPR